MCGVRCFAHTSALPLAMVVSSSVSGCCAEVAGRSSSSSVLSMSAPWPYFLHLALHIKQCVFNEKRLPDRLLQCEITFGLPASVIQHLSCRIEGAHGMTKLHMQCYALLVPVHGCLLQTDSKLCGLDHLFIYKCRAQRLSLPCYSKHPTMLDPCCCKSG